MLNLLGQFYENFNSESNDGFFLGLMRGQNLMTDSFLNVSLHGFDYSSVTSVVFLKSWLVNYDSYHWLVPTLLYTLTNLDMTVFAHTLFLHYFRLSYDLLEMILILISVVADLLAIRANTSVIYYQGIFLNLQW